jgi:S1-C subfamily serine protease
MATYPMLEQWNGERAGLLASILPRVGAVALGRRRVVSGIRWRGDLMVTAAESIAGAERVDVHFESNQASAEVLATDLATDVAVLRIVRACLYCGSLI